MRNTLNIIFFFSLFVPRYLLYFLFSIALIISLNIKVLLIEQNMAIYFTVYLFIAIEMD